MDISIVGVIMIYIRTDMNNIIATGHVMRCLSIAEAARVQGEGTTFLLADAQPFGQTWFPIRRAPYTMG